MKRIVLKIGSSSLFSGGEFAEEKINILAREIKKLKDSGVEVCLITSGAIAIGLKEMNLDKKPTELPKKQALAAIGQMYLMEKYEEIFAGVGVKPSQILLSHDDFGNRNRVKNLNNTITALFNYGVLPIINENDAISTDEIKVGDNDTLGAFVALNIDADLLVIISDVNGLYDKNPVKDPTAKLIERVEKIDKSITSLAKEPTSKVGTGGMITKIKAAKICTDSGIDMMIIGNDKIDKISTILDGANLGTIFHSKGKMPKSKNWILSCANVNGGILVDDGAKKALLKRSSLLSCGIIGIKGSFSHGSVVEILDKEGVPFAKGVASFGVDTIKTLTKGENQVIVHANNIALIEEVLW